MRSLLLLPGSLFKRSSGPRTWRWDSETWAAARAEPHQHRQSPTISPMTTTTAKRISDPPHAVRRGRDGRIQAGSAALNPLGRPAAGASYTEWLNTLAEVAHKRGGKDYLEKIADDDTEPLPKRQAALEHLGMLNREYSRSGQPLMASHRDAICDRTVGKPTQQIQVEATIQTLPEAEADLVATFRADRALLMMILGRLTEQIPGLRTEILEAMAPAPALPAPDGE